ncbi:hypothetical protein OG453_09400 [Streptomyces sp. NBC_01381]|uniref:hypothetical protein n=1 Tax=Streptomyces sp. NBC_01381 TaxID=2903845 RepID=UPI002251938C|nr:hypothetical protein [Streptomyces sp. NBC_01381]MCX4666881.1 hypothetical protein [Streptomyces sp. NBC_01381]
MDRTLVWCAATFVCGGDSYELRATITWKISWTSTTGEGGDLPDREFGAEQGVVVEEIQTVNR